MTACCAHVFIHGSAHCRYPRIHSGITNPIPRASPGAKDLLSRMLTPDPAKRITVPEVIPEHRGPHTIPSLLNSGHLHQPVHNVTCTP